MTPDPRRVVDTKARKFKLRHGMSGTPEYCVWVRMKNRCYSPRNNHYKYYGGRGIVVCDRWRDSFENFLADMGMRPPGTSLDRINNDGNYEPGNCRWATRKEQSRNMRRTLFVAYKGERLSVAELAERTGLSYPILHGRIRRKATGDAAVESLLSKKQPEESDE